MQVVSLSERQQLCRKADYAERGWRCHLTSLSFPVCITSRISGWNSLRSCFSQGTFDLPIAENHYSRWTHCKKVKKISFCATLHNILQKVMWESNVYLLSYLILNVLPLGILCCNMKKHRWPGRIFADVLSCEMITIYMTGECPWDFSYSSR